VRLAPELHGIEIVGVPSFKQRAAMLRWALVFLIVAIIAGVLGFGGIAGELAWMAKILFFLFLIVFVVSLIMGRKGSRAI
jgi:uncharacterized membrane protein YtjA (UPF0391 family)